MTNVVYIRPHHLNTLLLIWHPKADKGWGGNPIRHINAGYSREFGIYWKRTAYRIRTEEALLIEPIDSIDSFCQECPKRRSDCNNPEIEFEWREELRLFRELELKVGQQYPAREVVARIDAWVERYKPYLPLHV